MVTPPARAPTSLLSGRGAKVGHCCCWPPADEHGRRNDLTCARAVSFRGSTWQSLIKPGTVRPRQTDARLPRCSPSLELGQSVRQSRPAPGGSDAPLHGVDRLNERPNGHEGDATTRTPSTRIPDASSDLPAHGRPVSNAYCPSSPPAIPTIIAHDPARLSPSRQSAACQLRPVLDFSISRFVVRIHVHHVAAARSLPLTTLHLASP